MIEGVDFTVSYSPMVGIKYLRIIIVVESAEGIIIPILDMSNAF